MSIIEYQIIDCIEKAKQQVIDQFVNNNMRSWKKCYGDICIRVFADFIKKSIKGTYDVSEPNAYILGFPTEFDLLLINNGAKPIKYTNSYNPEDVKCGIEFKAHGLFGGKNDLKKVINSIRENFITVKSSYHHINFAYLTLQEVTSVKNASSINYFDETKKELLPFSAFCLRDSRNKKIIYTGQWQGFIREITR